MATTNTLNPVSKRSKGVIFFAWSFILFNIFTLLTIGEFSKSYFFLSKFTLRIIFFYALAYSLIGIFSGMNILGLKEFSRKLIIALAIIGILDMAVFAPLNHKSFNYPQVVEKHCKSMFEKTKSGLNMSKEEFIKLATKISHVMAMAIEVIFTLYMFVIIFFFTRGKVKLQFRR